MNYRIRYHPLVARDLDIIAHWILDYAGPDAATRKLGEIESAIAALKTTPHKGSLRDEIAPGLRAIPAGRKGLVAIALVALGEIIAKQRGAGGQRLAPTARSGCGLRAVSIMYRARSKTGSLSACFSASRLTSVTCSTSGAVGAPPVTRYLTMSGRYRWAGSFPRR